MTAPTYLAAALLHSHSSLQPESEHDMGTNDIGEQLAAAIETNIGAEAVIANALAIAEAFVDDGYKPRRTIWDIKDALAQRPSTALAEHDRELKSRDEGRQTRIRELLIERDGLLAQVAAAKAVDNYDISLRYWQMLEILAQSPAEALAEHDAEVAAKALRKFADDLTGYTLNFASPMATLHQIVGLLNRNADLAAEGATI